VAPHRRRPRIWVAAIAIAAAAVLSVPAPAPPLPELPAGTPFAWGEDALWRALALRFAATRAGGCGAAAPAVAAGIADARDRVASLAGRRVAVDAPELAALERALFVLGSDVAACPAHLAEYARLVAALRAAVKEQSRGWPAGDRATRDRLYRLLYGSRAALEEAMLQAPPPAVEALLPGTAERSAAPSARFHGVELRSGDILVSRGGAPTSALIARGNDYPGNFSHVALLHVAEAGEAAVVESHIERGVAISTPETYLADVKLRIMVLRARPDHPALARDPLLPHRAATAALAGARRRHVPYDFAMDWREPEKMFCSEVASAAYAAEGVTLWSALSRVSSPGTARWLAAFGVRHLVTQEPSDLEYDPQLVVVAEFRDPNVLFKDHVDNAVVDALLAAAEEGMALDYRRVLLPAARLAKAYSAALNLAGRVGPVPEGMSAAAALCARRLDEVHGALAADLRARAATFAAQRGHRPPYWELVTLAREALSARRIALPAGG
jgi:hypothetical protein